MKSKDLTRQNIEKISEFFPNIVTEIKDESGNIKQSIDFELLKQELSDQIVEGSKERYNINWPGKKEAIVQANTPIDKTLRPVKEESIDWENTENIYIEGDNLEVLKLLQESYLSKVKCIYIDPPYNTGKDFVYKDNFYQDKDEYAEESGQLDEEGNRLFQNTEYNGRYHSDWLTMIYPRLKLARNLLSEDGVIFISIDDNEVHNLRKICDEIFGERNFVANIIWEKKFSPQNDAKWLSDNHDHILLYAKNKEIWRPVLLPRTEKHNKRYKNPDYDPRGPWASSDLSVKTYSAQYDYIIKSPSGKIHELPPGRCWMTSKEKMEELIEDNRIWFGKDGDNLPRLKRFLSEVKEGITPITIWYRKDVGDNQSAKRSLLSVMPENVFQTPKPINLLKKIVYLSNKNKDSIILDFFSGSATTAHSVMQLNAEDGGNRKYIMVQIPEETDKKSEAYKAGYKTIAEIGKERIRRASKKIVEETNADIDYGFRVYKVDSSNMKDVYYLPQELKQDFLDKLESNIKEDRTGLDLLTQVILESGLELSLPIETRVIKDKEVHFVAGNSLVACFEEKIDEELIKEIAKEEPLRVIFRDNSFKTSTDRINLEEIFKSLSPNTKIKVL